MERKQQQERRGLVIATNKPSCMHTCMHSSNHQSSNPPPLLSFPYSTESAPPFFLCSYIFSLLPNIFCLLIQLRALTSLSVNPFSHLLSELLVISMRNPCCDGKDVNRGAWSRQEDQKLIDFVQAHGEGCWRSLSRQAGLLRCGNSCRLRWINYLRPDVKRGNFSDDEEDLIIKLHALLGNRWSLIAGRLPGRTDNEIKDYWNSHLRRKLVRNGIDPNNHRVNQTLTLQSRNRKLKEFEDSDSLNDGDSVSDAARCMEEDCGRGMPDLNLELTISLPSDCVAIEKQKNEVEGSKIEDMNSPTLVLFR